MEASEDQALEAVSQGIDQAFERADNSVILLLENTAGQGTEIGYNFEHLRRILDGVQDGERIGICLDTAHAFEAGYDLSRKEGIEQALESFDRTIGLNRLHLLHLNDSKTPLGSRKDRHWHIGEGYIGKEGFRHLTNHPSIRTLPGIMETPRKDTVEDLKNMRVIRSLGNEKFNQKSSIPFGHPIRNHLIQFLLLVIVQILLKVEHEIEAPVDPLGLLPKRSLEKGSHLLNICSLLSPFLFDL
jgi:endonuclease IV